MADDNQHMPKRATRDRYRVIVLPILRPIGQRLVLDNWLAITIARWIFAWRPLDDVELAHEVAHVRQWRDNGFFGYIYAYMGESRRAKARGGDRYFDNKFEVEARAAADAVRKRETPV